MKLKKILCIVFAVLFVAAASAIAIHAAENAEHAACCSNPNVVEELLGHIIVGNKAGCYALLQKKCTRCHNQIDLWEASYIPCPHSEGNIPYPDEY